MAQAARWMRMRIDSGGEPQAACAGLAAALPAAADPILVWLRSARECAYALIAPCRLAPGRAWRWRAWGAMPAVATCRQYGLPAYLEGDAIWMHGRRVAEVSAARVGECAVIEGAFPARLAAEPELESKFRERIEAQHGWRFDTAWPSGGEARR
ncbi:MAG TPA: hypothetical protein VFS80_12485 [Burkholderiales bacterium]|jgi:hypothetical protein|nr:hypothetical protein [Burkholderiales bacterium]